VASRNRALSISIGTLPKLFAISTHAASNASPIAFKVSGPKAAKAQAIVGAIPLRAKFNVVDKPCDA
jgi:hypothetical protein